MINVDDVYKMAKKHQDLSARVIDSDMYYDLKILIFNYIEFQKEMWNWPPQAVRNKVADQLRRYDDMLMEAYQNGWSLNGHVIAGMTELLEKIIEDNIKWIKTEKTEHALELRDRASAIFVGVKMFEMKKIYEV